MNEPSDLWNSIGALFGEIVALDVEERARRLRQLAAEDPDMAAELDELLAADALSDDLLAPLDRLASDLSISRSPAPAQDDEPVDPYGFVGQTIARYRVAAALGDGGMGVVYKAEDVQLRRTVALKFLPPGWNLDLRFKERFLREARAAAALDHPNVCTVYEVGESDRGQMFIAMAFYEGATLRRRLADGPPRLREAIDIAIQVARGLVAAHRHGIAHRDIKPANLLVTPDGTVKILDFGLATSRDDATAEAAPAMGTVSYMAPEQVRGEPAGTTVDLWALGVLLYEMVTGQRPFIGASRDAVFDAILHGAPDPPDELKPGTPAGLAALILRLLAKHPADRPDGARAVLDALLEEAERIASESGSPMRSLRRAARRHPWRTAVAGTAAMTAGIIGATVVMPAFAGRSPADELPDLSPEAASPIVADAGAEVNPAVSPDGRSIAYVRLQEPDVAELYVQSLDGGAPRLLSGGLDGTHWAPRWSPDGERLAFTTWQDDQSTIHVTGAFDGNPGPLLTAWSGPDPFTIAWSPDGRRLAYAVVDTIAVVDAADGHRLRTFHIELPPGRVMRPDPLRIHAPDWSPDGSTIAFACCNIHHALRAADFAATAPDNLFVLDLSGEAGEVRPLTDDISINTSPRWLPDSRHLLFVSNRSGTKDVFVVDASAEAGEIRQVTSGINAHTIDPGPDGELAYSVVTVNGNVWSVPLGTDGVATTRDAEPVTTARHDMVEFFDISDDGRLIAFDSNRDGNSNIWVGPVGGPATRITEDLAHDWDPQLSPDGSRLAFYSIRTGNRDVYVMGTDGNGLVQVTSDPANDFWPYWVDDSTILFFSRRSEPPQLYETRERADGSWGQPRSLTPRGGTYPLVSPDRSKVLFSRPPAWRDRRFILDLRDASAPVRELDFIMEFWSEDSRSGYTVDREPDGRWLISRRFFDGGAPTPVLRLDDHDGGFQVRNGRLYFMRRRIESDIWSMRLARQR